MNKYNNLFYDENYEILSFDRYSSGEKKFIGNGIKCRFCKKDKSETTFSNKSHAIPESIGNKKIILRDECDICNKFFSENLEDHFDKYTKPYRTFARIKGKKKIPTYKSKDHQTRISVDNQQDIEIFIPLESKIDAQSNTIKILLDFEPHIPAAVYKTLVKMALSLIEEEEENEILAFQVTIKWLLEKDHSKHFMFPLKMLTQFIGNGDALNSFVCLLRRKEGKIVPYAIFVIGFGNWVYQIFVPSHLDSQPCSYSIPYLHIPCNIVSKEVVDLSSSEKKSFSETRTIQYRIMEDFDVSE